MQRPLMHSDSHTSANRLTFNAYSIQQAPGTIKTHMPSTPPNSHLEGFLERITYYDEDSHFAIARLRIGNADQLVTILGTLPNPNLGEVLKISGSWQNHARYGEQFKFDSFEVVLPSDVEGIRKYLESGAVKGIGSKTATRLVNHFREHTLHIIEHEPQKLMEVKGIGSALTAQISISWKRHHAMRDLIRYLQDNGIKTSYCAKLFKLYGSDAVSIIQEDPYRLVDDLPGIGFHIADAVLRNSHEPIDESKRTRACLLYLLQQISDDGHVFIHKDQLAERCRKQFEIAPDAVDEALFEFIERKDIVVEKDAESEASDAIYPRAYYEAEAGIANKLAALLSVPITVPDLDADRITGTILNELSIRLSREQIDILQEIFRHRVAIITGGPGTGKTTLVRSIATLFEMISKQTRLAAPTGRAARRLSEVTGRKAETIHKMLGCSPSTGRFEKNRDNPLKAEVVIVDEASMVDTLLMYHAVQAIPMQARLILVGDVFQLPSVGPGSVLFDLIRSERLPTFELTRIFRQEKESRIVHNAHRIRNGEPPVVDSESPDHSDFYFIEQPNPDRIVKTIVKLCTKQIPERYGLDPKRDIQVITPMHRGRTGTINLNQVLQKELNLNPLSEKGFGGPFKIDDKVMHLRNNYEKDVFNGDIGTIQTITEDMFTLAVEYEGRTVSYDFSELDELALAYAISVHKSQGSEYPAVIIPLTTQHYPLLQRNLLYTAITRGKELVILIGTRKAVSVALKNDKTQKRLTGLAQKLALS